MLIFRKTWLYLQGEGKEQEMYICGNIHIVSGMTAAHGDRLKLDIDLSASILPLVQWLQCWAWVVPVHQVHTKATPVHMPTALSWHKLISTSCAVLLTSENFLLSDIMNNILRRKGKRNVELDSLSIAWHKPLQNFQLKIHKKIRKYPLDEVSQPEPTSAVFVSHQKMRQCGGGTIWQSRSHRNKIAKSRTSPKSL